MGQNQRQSSFDAEHYGSSVNTAAELTAILHDTLRDRRRCYVRDLDSVYFWQAAAVTGTYQADDAPGATGWWRQGESAVPAVSLADVLQEDESTSGNDIVFTAGDKLDFSGVGDFAVIMSFPSSGTLQHFAGGILKWKTNDMSFESVAGAPYLTLHNTGELELGGLTVDGSIRLWDASSDFSLLIDAPNITAARLLTWGDGDMNFSGGEEGDVFTTQADGSMTWQKPDVQIIAIYQMGFPIAGNCTSTLLWSDGTAFTLINDPEDFLIQLNDASGDDLYGWYAPEQGSTDYNVRTIQDAGGYLNLTINGLSGEIKTGTLFIIRQVV